MNRITAICLLALGLFVGSGCVLPLLGVTGIRVDVLPRHLHQAGTSEVAVTAVDEEGGETALDLETLLPLAATPAAGALLYQYVLRPLRKRCSKVST